MMTVTRRAAALLAFLACVAASACSSDPIAPTAGPDASIDAGAPVDPGVDGGGPSDAAADAASPKDAGDILGSLSGACGTVRGEIGKVTPALIENSLAFVAGESYTRASLSTDGQAVYDAQNAGGSSSESEVMSFEVLHLCDGAKLLKTETFIGYQPPDDAGSNAITDILVEIDGKKVGVSVTRAYRPQSLGYTDADARDLLTKKLEGVNRSSVRVLPADKWVKQVLHIFASNPTQRDAVRRVWPTLDASLRADTVVVLTETTGGGFIYCNPDPPLGAECP